MYQRRVSDGVESDIIKRERGPSLGECPTVNSPLHYHRQAVGLSGAYHMARHNFSLHAMPSHNVTESPCPLLQTRLHTMRVKCYVALTIVIEY